ncbi:hypothetical protein [Natronomonas amylolytica]|uniref:hypothetical protein n=1 Tax=Natronomonas amylolytica TaxID=3108498 RepID=UPI003008BF7D
MTSGSDASLPARANPREWTRRQLLAVLGAGGLGGAAVGGRMLSDPEDAETSSVDEAESRALAEQFAPEVYYDRYEKWFMTDPRPYTTDRDGETVVDGFAALNDYTRAFEEAGEPPESVVFYNAVQYEDSPLAVVQYWMYSAFDQFATNFHWHDWEVLHVFVDTETEEVQLYVASAHSRKIPNNEYLDPDAQPAIVTELGAHASGLGVNANPDRFQRFPTGDLGADITNQLVEGVEELAEIPLAYGLPRDENLTLAFAMPTLDGQPLYEDDRLPDVPREAFIDADLTVRSFSDLAAPPTDFPTRETGLHFAAEVDDDADPDHEYRLEPSTELEDIGGFVGPMLRFEFSIPDFAEDAIAGHLTTSGVPWDQPRYENPGADITDPNHRRMLADRYDAIDYGGPTTSLVGAIGEAVEDAEAPDGNGVTTAATGTLAFCLLESDPTAVPSVGGAVVMQDVDPGEHRLTVNAPGTAPYSERLSVGEESETPTTPGADGQVTLVANENAVKIDGDSSDGPDIERVAIEDDFGGRLFEFKPDSPDKFAAYVHSGGAYTTEIRDTEGTPGAYRVNPGEENRRTIENPRTGKASLAEFVANITTETSEQAPAFSGDDDTSDDGDSDDDDDDLTETPTDGGGGGGPTDDIDVSGVTGLQRALQAVAESAQRAVERAEQSDTRGADRALEAARTRLEKVGEALQKNDFDETLNATVQNRLEQAQRRIEQALETEKA